MELRRHVAALCIEDERDASGVMRGVTKEYADTGTVGPFVMRLDGLEVIFKHVDRRTKWFEVL